MHLSPAPQLTHTAAPAGEYVPAQRRHASVHRHAPPLPLAVLHQLPSAARRHAHMLHLSSTPHFDTRIQQPRGPPPHTTQSNKPPILPAVYRYSRRTSSSVMHTETRLGKRACHEGMTCRACGIQLSPATQSRQSPDATAPSTLENLPVQHRHGSVDRHEPLGLAVLH